jgi:hypothetical protein
VALQLNARSAFGSVEYNKLTQVIKMAGFRENENKTFQFHKLEAI